MTGDKQTDRGSWGGVGSNRLDQVVEALVFAADHPIEAIRVAEIYGEITGQDRPAEEEIVRSVDGLNERYVEQDRPLRIESWAGGYRMATTPEVAPYIKELYQSEKKRRLSRSLLETLAILAYRQPATRPELEFVRGVNCDYAVGRLLELGLVDVVGRSESVGTPLLYGTTRRFLELFGLNSISDMPNLREIESILDDPEFHRERALLMMRSGLPELKQSGDSVGEAASDRDPTE